MCLPIVGEVHESVRNVLHGCRIPTIKVDLKTATYQKVTISFHYHTYVHVHSVMQHICLTHLEKQFNYFICIVVTLPQ